MATSAAWSRLRLWRLTRNRYARGLYERLDDAGFVLASLDRFVRGAEDARRGTSTDSPDCTAVDAVRFRRAGADGGLLPALADDPLAPEDLVLTAERDGETIGYCVLSDRPAYVPELHRRLEFPGGYVWRVYVDPAERGQGVGTSLVDESVRVAAEHFDAPSVSALVAPDNLPSRRAFESVGFEARERLTTLGVAGWTWTRGTPP